MTCRVVYCLDSSEGIHSKYLLMSIYSLFRSRKPETSLLVDVYLHNPEKHIVDCLSSLSGEHHTIRILPVDPDLYKKCQLHCDIQWNPIIYYRSYLFRSYSEPFLYLDNDTIVQHDISELFQQMDGTAALYGCLDPLKKRYNSDPVYLNSGVLLVDPSKVPEDFLLNFESFCQKNNTLYPDQDAINHTLMDKKKTLSGILLGARLKTGIDPRSLETTTGIHFTNLDEFLHRMILIHYTGQKPDQGGYNQSPSNKILELFRLEEKELQQNVGTFGIVPDSVRQPFSRSIGDELSSAIVSRLGTDLKLYPTKEKPCLRVSDSLTEGSSMTMVWGGSIPEKVSFEYVCLLPRGPITEAAVRKSGRFCISRYGDPKIFIPYLFGNIKRKSNPSYDLGIVENLSSGTHDPVPANPKGLSVLRISPYEPIFDLLKKLSDCRYVYGNSLSTLIIGEAMGCIGLVPSIPSREQFRFLDYVRGSGRVGIRMSPKGFIDLDSALPPPVYDLNALFDTYPFPIEEELKNGLRNYFAGRTL